MAKRSITTSETKVMLSLFNEFIIFLCFYYVLFAVTGATCKKWIRKWLEKKCGFLYGFTWRHSASNASYSASPDLLSICFDCRRKKSKSKQCIIWWFVVIFSCCSSFFSVNLFDFTFFVINNAKAEWWLRQ